MRQKDSDSVWTVRGGGEIRVYMCVYVHKYTDKGNAILGFIGGKGIKSRERTKDGEGDKHDKTRVSRQQGAR